MAITGALFLLAATRLEGSAKADPQFSKGTLGAFSPSTGTVTFDTDAGTWSGSVSGSGGRVVLQNGNVAIMVFDFTSISVPAGVKVLATGARAFALTATGAVTIDGTIDVSGEDCGGVTLQRGGNAGPGGGGGGGGGDAIAHPGDVSGGKGGLGTGGYGYLGEPSMEIVGSDGTGLFFGRRGFRGAGGAGGSGTNGAAPLTGTPTYGGGGGGGGPGGGAGGSYGDNTGCASGFGIASGSGGGFGLPGEDSPRAGATTPAILGGPAYGSDDLAVFSGGSGGGGGGEDRNVDPGYNGGGGGGGAVMITSLVSISVGATGQIVAKGGSGRGSPTRPPPFTNTTTWSAGGGGAGGAIYLDAPTVTSAGSLCVAGGIGGSVDPTNVCPAFPSYKHKAGNGGGGRIALFGALASGTVCAGSGTIKIGNFRCATNAECNSGVCDTTTHECVGGLDGGVPDAGITDSGSDAPVIDASTPDASTADASTDGSVDASAPDATGPGIDGSLPDASQGPDSLGGGGCACRTAGDSPGGLWADALLAFGVVAFVRRRRATDPASRAPQRSR